MIVIYKKEPNFFSFYDRDQIHYGTPYKCHYCSGLLSGIYGDIITSMKESGFLDKNFKMSCCFCYNLLNNNADFYVRSVGKDEINILMDNYEKCYDINFLKSQKSEILGILKKEIERDPSFNSYECSECNYVCYSKGMVYGYACRCGNELRTKHTTQFSELKLNF